MFPAALLTIDKSWKDSEHSVIGMDTSPVVYTVTEDSLCTKWYVNKEYLMIRKDFHKLS